MATSKKNDKFEDKGTIRVLVYGTLKKDQSNYPLMTRIRGTFLGRDSVTGQFELMDLGPFPCVVDKLGKDSKDSVVRGEMYSIDEDGLAHLDFLEGHPHFYTRRKVWTDVWEKRVWVYFMAIPTFALNNTDRKECEDGLWQPTEDEINWWLQFEQSKPQLDA